MSRCVLIGDIHGCLDEFEALVHKLNLRSNDRVICLGDFMDKGPMPARCVKFAREQGFESLLANHEETHIRWRQHTDRQRRNPAYVNPMKPMAPEAIRERATVR